MNKHDVPRLLQFDPSLVPLRVEGDVVRVGKGRVTLDLVVDEYKNGMSPEAMVRAYDTLVLEEVRVVVGYYQQHREAVDEYMRVRAEAAAVLRARIETEHPRIPAEELIARRAAKELAHAPARE